MARYADLEIGLHRRTAGSYAVEMCFTNPNDECTNRDEGEARFDFAALLALEADPLAYGKKLAECLFASLEARTAWARAQAVAQEQDPPLGLRVRLLVGSSAPDLHRLHWETITLPDSDVPLCTGEDTLFSRYLTSRDWRPVRLRPKGDLKALLVVASPTGLDRYGLAPVDVEGEVRRAREALGAIAATVLPEGRGDAEMGAGEKSDAEARQESRGRRGDAEMGAGKTTAPEGRGARRATLEALLDYLREGGHDILYLVCHGALIRDVPWLLLEDADGNACRVPGRDLVAGLRDLRERPRLVVLLSCQSARPGTGDALAALGPQLAREGIPAVLAMQGDLRMDTAARFMPAFFRELNKDGLVDRALAAARGKVRDQPDAWVPALFSRLKSGQIWYVPHFSGAGTGGSPGFDAWAALKNAIREKRCTPVLGPGLLDPWLGPTSEIAWRWANAYRYPLSPEDCEELPRVAQFISRRDGPVALLSEYNGALREEIRRRYQALLPAELGQAAFWKAPQALQALEVVAEKNWDSPLTLVQRQLAALRLPVYITAGPDGLLAQALKKRGANPQVRLCPWWGPDKDERERKCLYTDEPSEDAPLVYHLYGRLDTPASLVISEDDYFDFLIGYHRQKKDILPIIRDVLVSTSLLFLGFRVDDWSFRVLFRTIIAQGGIEMFHKNLHVTVQVEPEEGRLIDTQRARRYLEQIFTKDNIAIYWGRGEDFVNELARQGGGA